MKDSVSVIIPVYNDVNQLKVCLEALSRQTYNNFKVIVVDNGKNKGIKELVKNYANVKLTFEKKPGLHISRNTGIKKSKGDILAFTDADCIPKKDWIENGVKTIAKSKNIGLVAGKFELFFKNPKKPTAAELFDKMTGFDQEKYIKKYHFGAHGNIFTTKKVVNKVGLLNGNLKSGADLVWGQKIYKAKFEQKYASDVVVKHPARISIKQIIQKHRRVVGGLYDMKKENYPLKSFLINLKDDWPQIKDFKNIFKDKRMSELNQKLKVFFVMILVKIARVLERIKLRFGGEAKRI